jgi:hypothetical protein
MAFIPGEEVKTTTRKRKKISDDEAKNYNVNSEEDKKKQEEADALKKLTDPVEILNTLRRSGGDARSYHKSNWDKNWRLYNNDYDFSLKADWQSKNFVAVVPVIVRGRIDAATTDTGRIQQSEVNAFNLVSNWMSVMDRIMEAQQKSTATDGKPVVPFAAQSLMNERLWGLVRQWEDIRRKMTIAKIPPVGMHLKPVA